jgi:hypothetical protein
MHLFGNMQPIGFSTGSLYRSGIPFDERVKLYHRLGADAIELSFSTPDWLLKYQLTKDKINNIGKFDFISIHAPWKNEKGDGSIITGKVIEKLRLFCSNLNVSGIVVHPHTVGDFAVLEETGLPFLIENMDGRKKDWISPIQFSEFKKRYSLGFVLDVQHAYEHDPSMELAMDLIGVMGDRLGHMHVSGCTSSEIHFPVFSAENQAAINKILGLKMDVPKILEGILTGNVDETIRHELDYIRVYETN